MRQRSLQFSVPVVLALLSALALTPAQARSPGLLGQLDPVDDVPMSVIAAPSIPAPNDARGGAERYAVPVSKRLAMPQRGRWEPVDAQRDALRLRIFSAGAESLSLAFDDFFLPTGAELYIYGPDGSLVHGPYTPAKNRPDGQFWTPIVIGDTLIVEALVPRQHRDALALDIAEVHHGYKAFWRHGTLGESGACNIDVACAEADGWRDEIRSAARITISGGFICSAVLLNNHRRDTRPLLLTATHCLTQDDPASVIAYWNYENSECSGIPNGALAQSSVGSTLLFTHNRSDATLLELDPIPAAYDVHYAGWDASGRASPSGAGIHHPKGEEKHISLYRNTVSSGQTTVPGLPTLVRTWRVTWSTGVTEEGSSGSGLWNDRCQVIGQLSGGNSSCSNPGGADFYGRLGVAWNAGLSAHLDPDAGGLRQLAGMNQDGSGGASCSPPTGQGLIGGNLNARDGGGGQIHWTTVIFLWLLAGLRFGHAKMRVRLRNESTGGYPE